MDYRLRATQAAAIFLSIACVCGEIDPGILPEPSQAAYDSPNSVLSSLSHSSSLVSSPNSDRLDSSDPFDRQQSALPTPETVSVAIVGAGFAGLSAYRRLSLAGFRNVHVYEASDRPGGRVYPVPFGDGYLQHGAEFINGAENPIFEVARRLGLVTGELEDDTLLDTAAYKTGKCRIATEQIEAFEKFSAELETQYHQLAKNSQLWQKTVGELYAENYKTFIESRKPSANERKVFDALSRFYRSYYEGEWSAPIDKELTAL